MAVMDDFATAQQMEQRSKGAITATSHQYLATELKAATRLIRNFCRWHVAKREQLTFTHRGRFVEDVWLPAMEIASIESVTVDGTALDVDGLAAVQFDENTGWTNLRACSWEIGFTAGYEEVPEDLTDLTLQVASRALGSPLGIVREQAGTTSVTYSQMAFNVAGGTALLDFEKFALSEYVLGRLP